MDALRWAAHQAEFTGDSLEAVITWEITPTATASRCRYKRLRPAASRSRRSTRRSHKVLGEPGAHHVKVRVVEGSPAKRFSKFLRVRTCSSWAVEATGRS